MCHYVGAPGSPAMSPPTEAELAAWRKALEDIARTAKVDVVWGESCPD